MNTIFDVVSIDRRLVKWEDYIGVLTPVEYHKDINTGRECFYKREDYFAPLGYGGINGSKLRQAIYLGCTRIANTKSPYIVGAMSTHSPQLPMQTAVAKHFGKKTVTITGGSNPKASISHPMVEMAAWFGSEFCLSKVGYNAVLQARGKEIRDYIGGDTFYMEYGITLDETHSDREIFDFHLVGAEQVKNIPDHITDLVIPAGSCNSATSVLLGLILYPKMNIKRIHLVGTGPSKIPYMTERIERMENILGYETRIFSGLPYKKKSTCPEEFQFKTVFYDLHGEKYCKYEDRMDYKVDDDIELHPTYEGKIMRYINERMPDLVSPNTLFWIVGSEPKKEAMKPYYSGVEVDSLPMFKG